MLVNTKAIRTADGNTLCWLINTYMYLYVNHSQPVWTPSLLNSDGNPPLH